MHVVCVLLFARFYKLANVCICACVHTFMCASCRVPLHSHLSVSLQSSSIFVPGFWWNASLIPLADMANHVPSGAQRDVPVEAGGSIHMEFDDTNRMIVISLTGICEHLSVRAAVRGFLHFRGISME